MKKELAEELTKKLKEKLDTLNEEQLSLVLNYAEDLTREIKLPKVLEDKLETIGNSPLDEPVIAETRETILKKQEHGDLSPLDYPLDLLESVYTIDEIENLDVDINELSTFGMVLHKKVFSLREKVDGKEILKEIPSQNELKPISYQSKRKIRSISLKIKELNSIERSKPEEKRDFTEIEKLFKEQKQIIQESHNLNTNSMSEWEKELLTEKIIAHAFGNYMPPMGKK